MKNKLVYLSALCMILIGCAHISPQLMNMVPYIPPSALHHSNKTLKIGEVIGGEKSDPILKGSRIDAVSFKGALLLALQNSKIFQIVDANQISDYSINAILIDQDQPVIGINTTTTLIVKYILIDESTQQEIWSKVIKSVYTAKSTDSLIGAIRLNMANEGAVRENIKILLNELSSLNL